jgi:prolyl-tRNA editing enzyme YbaK/EbsC (Cys-tRNA(Pro) deacylase)
MRNSVDVHNHLQSLGVKHELVALPGEIKDVHRMAELLGLEASSVVSTEIYIADGKPVAVLIPSDRKLVQKKLKAALAARKVRLASDPEIIKHTEYFPRCVPPVALKASPDVVADNKISELDVVYAFGGELTVVLKMRASDLLPAGGCLVADIAVG